MSLPHAGADVPPWLSVRPAPAAEVGDVGVRAWSRADGAQLLLAVLESLEELRAWMPWATTAYGPEDAASFVEHALGARADSREFLYAIVDPDGEVLGACGLRPGLRPGGLEIGYWVHTAHAGRGVATLATAALVGLALDLGEVTHVEVRHDQANRRSERIPRRLGFARVAARPADPTAPRNTGTEVVWRLDRAAYHASAARRLVRSHADSRHC